MQAALSNVKEPWTHAAQLDSLSAQAAELQPTSGVDEPSTTMERFLCEICGDVIGIYEPLMMRTIESERTTSRAAEPELRARDGAYLHRECHDTATG